jgi:hypothetical protein
MANGLRCSAAAAITPKRCQQRQDLGAAYRVPRSARRRLLRKRRAPHWARDRAHHPALANHLMPTHHPRQSVFAVAGVMAAPRSIARSCMLFPGLMNRDRVIARKWSILRSAFCKTEPRLRVLSDPFRSIDHMRSETRISLAVASAQLCWSASRPIVVAFPTLAARGHSGRR